MLVFLEKNLSIATMPSVDPFARVRVRYAYLVGGQVAHVVGGEARGGLARRLLRLAELGCALCVVVGGEGVSQAGTSASGD